MTRYEPTNQAVQQLKRQAAEIGPRAVRRAVERGADRVRREVADRSKHQSMLYHATEHVSASELRQLVGTRLLTPTDARASVGAAPIIDRPPPPSEPPPGCVPSPYDLFGGGIDFKQCFGPALVALLLFAVIAVPIALWGGSEPVSDEEIESAERVLAIEGVRDALQFIRSKGVDMEGLGNAFELLEYEDLASPQAE